MGQLTSTSACGPNGQTIVTVNATNGYLDVEIDGILVTTDSDGDGHHDLVTGPGVHTAVWWKPGTTERIPENVWGTKSITVPALTDCAAAPTTTIAATPTTPVDGSTSTTALVPPSTINLTVCDITPSDCIGLVTTVAGPPPTLPATGAGSDAAFQLAGGLLLVGVALMVVKRFAS